MIDDASFLMARWAKELSVKIESYEIKKLSSGHYGFGVFARAPDRSLVRHSFVSDDPTDILDWAIAAQRNGWQWKTW